MTRTKIASKIFAEAMLQRTSGLLKKNVMIILTGVPGDGKSMVALRLAEMVHQIRGEKFSLDNVCFTAKEFVGMVKGKTLKPGSVLIMDETGTQANAKRHMSSVNVILSYLSQTVRKYRYIMVFCVPDMSFIDSQLRKLFHVHMMTYKINLYIKQNFCQVDLLQKNQKTGAVYRHPFRIINPDTGMKVPVEYLCFNLPFDKKFRDSYEKKKDQFNTDLYEKLDNVLNSLDQAQSGKGVLTAAQEKVYKLYSQGLTQEQIAQSLDISQPAVSSALQGIKRKGYMFSV